MGVNFVKQILGNEEMIQWAITRAIASVVEDLKDKPEEFREFFNLMKDNMLFQAMVDEVFMAAAKEADEIIAAAPTANFGSVMDKTMLVAAGKIFMAGMDMGRRTISTGIAMVRAKPEERELTAKQTANVGCLADIEVFLDAIGAAMKEDIGRHMPVDGDGSIEDYVSRITKALYPNREAEQLAEAAMKAAEDASGEIPAQAIRMPRGDGSEASVAEMANTIAAQMMAGHSGPAKGKCGCRGVFLQAAGLESLEGFAERHAAGLPAVLADAIHKMTQELKLTGVIGAVELAATDKGRAKLSQALASQPIMRDMGKLFTNTVVVMHGHGGNVSHEDCITVMAALISTVLTFAATDMVAPPPSGVTLH
jgi:hypothetical protein